MQHESGGKLCDFHSWNHRGWCKMEETARRLCHFRKPVVVITGRSQACLHDSYDYMLQPVGLSEFSCCENNHEFNGQPVPCDKMVLAPVVQELLRYYIAQIKGTHPFYFRLLRSLSPALMDGLPHTDKSVSFEHFSRELGLCVGVCTASKGDCGWGPLFFAALMQNLPAMAEFIRRGAPVDQRSSRKPEGVLLADGSTPLMAAAFFVRSGAAVRLLLQHGAECNAKNREQHSALFLAAFGGHAANVEALLAGGALHLGGPMESQPIHIAAVAARYAALRALVCGGAEVSATTVMGAMAVHGAALNGHVPMLVYLLECGADKDQRHVPRTPFAKAVFRVASLRVACGERDQGLESVAHAHLGTPLMSAALHGQVGCVEELLRRGAHPGLRNHLGKTAADLARSRGHWEAMALLQEECN